MYKEFETKTSFNYLKEVIHNLEEPICILGGWAVFFHVNERFQQAQGRPYLGSRDIDLGFNLSKDTKVLSKTISILKEKLKFKPLSFRMVKEIHTETGGEIKDFESIPSYFTFPMFVDLIVDAIPQNFKKDFGFNPIDEPLLKTAFDNKEFIILKEFDKRLLLPNPEILLAMKVNSLPLRDKEHKRIKDICDIFALAWYADLNLEKINLSKFLSKKKLELCLKTITEEDYEKSAIQLGHEKEDLKRVISLICGK